MPERTPSAQHIDPTVLASVIYNPDVLERLSSVWPDGKNARGLFDNDHANLIAGWAVRFSRQYPGKAPGKVIGSYLRKWYDQNHGREADLSAIESILHRAAEEKGVCGGKHTERLMVELESAVRNADIRTSAMSLLQLSDAGDYERAAALLTARGYQLPTIGNEDVTADDFDMESVNWLWNNFLARGQMTIIDGDPGVSKGILSVDIAARVTRGWAMPPAKPGTPDPDGRGPLPVALFSPEDSWKTTIKPRLEAAGADPKMIHSLKHPIFLPQDLSTLCNFLRRHRPALAVFDPVTALNGRDDFDANSDTHVRRYLGPILETIGALNVAGWLVRHNNKRSRERAINMGIGARAWGAVSRINLQVGYLDPRNPATVHLSTVKNNLGRKATTLVYEIENKAVYNRAGERINPDPPVLNWIGEDADVTADDLTMRRAKNEAEREDRRGRPKKLEDVASYMERLVRSQGGEMPSTDFIEEVQREMDVSERTIERAKKMAGLRSQKEGRNGDTKWFVLFGSDG